MQYPANRSEVSATVVPK